MKLIFADEAWEDYLYWQKQDKRIVERINKLIRETQREPFAGVGKPEPLKHALSGFWSRRTTDEHRMVYHVENDALMIAQLRFHYCGSRACLAFSFIVRPHPQNTNSLLFSKDLIHHAMLDIDAARKNAD